jgi:uncharacterized protein YecA (UPF0149 family)
MKGIRITEIKQRIQSAAADLKALPKDKLMENFTNDMKKRQIAWTANGQLITESDLEFGLKEEWKTTGFIYRGAGITWDELLAAGKLAIADTSGSYELPKNVQRIASIVGRNQPCPCGSGIKFKKCCGK